MGKFGGKGSFFFGFLHRERLTVLAGRSGFLGGNHSDLWKFYLFYFSSCWVSNSADFLLVFMLKSKSNN